MVVDLKEQFDALVAALVEHEFAAAAAEAGSAVVIVIAGAASALAAAFAGAAVEQTVEIAVVEFVDLNSDFAELVTAACASVELIVAALKWKKTFKTCTN